MAASRRIQKEWADLQADCPVGCQISPEEGNLLKWNGVLQGPYPLIQVQVEAPTVKFLTKIYHMNITEEGLLCIGLLKSDSWKPSTKINQVLLALMQLLEEPNPDDALVASTAELYQSDRKRHDNEARAFTKKYAM